MYLIFYRRLSLAFNRDPRACALASTTNTLKLAVRYSSTVLLAASRTLATRQVAVFGSTGEGTGVFSPISVSCRHPLRLRRSRSNKNPMSINKNIFYVFIVEAEVKLADYSRYRTKATVFAVPMFCLASMVMNCKRSSSRFCFLLIAR
jgi:hypothetical protein